MTPTTRPEPFVSLNAILFFLLPTLGMIIVMAGGISQITIQSGWMLPFALFCLIVPLVYISLGQRPSASTDRRRFIWAATACVVLVLGLTARQIVIRQPASHPNGIYDGAIQSEIAADFLLHGRNPYGADYRGTAYANVNKPVIGNPNDNVVWYHYIYPPLTFLLYTPISIFRGMLGPLADYRLVTVGALLFFSWLIVHQARSWSHKTTAMLLTLGNPLLWGYAIIGCNEILVVTALVGSGLLLERRRWLYAGLAFGLALAAKQVAWVLAPLWLYWLWQKVKDTDQPWKNTKRTLGGLIAGSALLLLPFFLWGPTQLITDTIKFASGSIPNSYPTAGTTFLQYLYVFHVIPSPYSVVPVYLFQLLVGFPTFLLVSSWLRVNREIARWLAGSAVLILAILLVSKFFNNNFLATPAALLATAYVLQQRDDDQLSPALNER